VAPGCQPFAGDMGSPSSELGAVGSSGAGKGSGRAHTLSALHVDDMHAKDFAVDDLVDPAIAVKFGGVCNTVGEHGSQGG
jgi:hypothetical protein